MQAPINKVAAGLPETLTFDDDDISDDDDVMDAADNILAEEYEEDGDAEEDAAAHSTQPALQSNEQYLKSRTRVAWSSDDEDTQPSAKQGEQAGHGGVDEEEDEEEGHDEDHEEHDIEEEHDPAGDAQATAADPPDTAGLPDAAETGRLFVRNLPYAAGEDDIAAHFEGVGQVKGVHLVLDRATRKSKGVAFVEFMVADDAARAMEGLDGSIFQGRLLHVLPARAAPATVPPTPDQVC